MNTPFSPGSADFSGMDGTHRLSIQNIFQKTYIQVDEEGTEASAVNMTIFETINAPLGNVSMVVDHPFIFFIRDTQSGTILFLGRVTSLP
jgi:serpin B